MNERIRALNSFLQSNFVQNPAIAAADLANFPINNLADPQADQDAVNLRTLKKYASPSTAAQPVAAARGIITFGLDDDSTGTNLVGKYGVVPFGFAPTKGYISVVQPPLTGASMFDILHSSDKGMTWTSIFPIGGQPNFPSSAPGLVVSFAGFASGFNAADLVRIDGLASGGASGIIIVVSN